MDNTALPGSSGPRERAPLGVAVAVAAPAPPPEPAQVNAKVTCWSNLIKEVSTTHQKWSISMSRSEVSKRWMTLPSLHTSPRVRAVQIQPKVGRIDRQYTHSSAGLERMVRIKDSLAHLGQIKLTRNESPSTHWTRFPSKAPSPNHEGYKRLGALALRYGRRTSNTKVDFRIVAPDPIRNTNGIIYTIDREAQLRRVQSAH